MSFSLSAFIPVWIVEAGGAVVALVAIIGLFVKLRKWPTIVNPLRLNGEGRQHGLGKALTEALKISLIQ